MLKAVLSPCCHCGRYWVAVLIRDEVFVETRNVSADSEDDAQEALNGYVLRHYGAPLESTEIEAR